MTRADINRVENELGITLPAEYTRLLSSRRAAALAKMTTNDSAPFFDRRLYLDADRIIWTNLSERRLNSATGDAFPRWMKSYVLIGDNGGGDFYCLRLDGSAGVFLMGADSGRAKKVNESLSTYIDDQLAEYPQKLRASPATGRSAFNGACPPAERVAVFLYGGAMSGIGRIVYQGDDTKISQSLKFVAISRTALCQQSKSVLGAMMQCDPEAFEAKVTINPGEPILRLEFSKLPAQLNGRAYWYADLAMTAKSIDVSFEGFPKGRAVPKAIKFEWSSFKILLAELLTEACPGDVQVRIADPKTPVIRKNAQLVYSLPYTITE